MKPYSFQNLTPLHFTQAIIRLMYYFNVYDKVVEKEREISRRLISHYSATRQRHNP